MSFKSDLNYYLERLKDRNLLLRAVKVRVKKERFYAVPCGGERVTGNTHFFYTLADAKIVLETLVASGENFPDLRAEPVINWFGDPWVVKWGKPEPQGIKGWEYELAIAKQLGYNDECMPAHYERCKNSMMAIGIPFTWAYNTC